MVIGTASVWLAIGPALIAGGIGLTSAFLSFASAQRTLAHGELVATATRSHEQDLLILNRRLSAIETIWQSLFEMERLDIISDRTRLDLIRTVVWLPSEVRQKILNVVVEFDNGALGTADIDSVRKLL